MNESYCWFIFFFQAEDGIRDAQESRGLGDVYKRQVPAPAGVRTAARTHPRPAARDHRPLSQAAVGAAADAAPGPVRAGLRQRGRRRTLRGGAGSDPSRGRCGRDLLHLSLIHISEPTRLLSISYAVFCLKKKKKNKQRRPIKNT